MQDIKLNITYSMNTNTFSTPAEGQTVAQQMSNLVKKVHEGSDGARQEENSKMMSRIRAKIKQGKKLSAKEEAYLKNHDPELYMQYMRIRKMVECMEQRLKNAQSKEEVNDIIYQSLNSVSDDDPYKEAIVNAMEEAIKDFKKSDAYQKLPDTREEAKEAKEAKPKDAKKSKSEAEDSFDPMSWSPLQELIDAMPTFEKSS